MIDIQQGASKSPPRIYSGWTLSVVVLMTTSCLFDSSNRCGDHQEYSKDLDACLCKKGYVAKPSGCEKEPKKEPAMMAEPEPQPAAGDGGPSGDGGDASSSSKPPEPETAVGMACATNDDCAGTDATFCDTFVTMGCLTEGCADNSDCAPGYQCSDLTALGAAGNVCVAAECNSAADDCPDGFTCCEPTIPGFPTVCLAGGCPG